jgi:hypothetical protein
MKFFKYPLFLIGIILVILVFFWDDIKKLIKKLRDMTIVKFKMNVNNPFNIRTNAANKWQGKTTPAGAPFEHFDTIENGIRAGIILLRNYITKKRLTTIREILTTYAPNTENDTRAYISFVEKESGFDPDQTLAADKETIWKLAYAMCQMENGYKLNREDYERAWKMA